MPSYDDYDDGDGGNGVFGLLLGLGLVGGAAFLFFRSRAAAASPRDSVASAVTAPSLPSDAGSLRYASWHAQFAPMVGGPADAAILRSGCSPDADGNIQCDPETMRASAERQLQASGFWPEGKPLDLATYTLARYMHSEIGSGRAEERVAVGEVAVNRARLRKQDVNGLLLRTQPNGLYGQINVPGKGNVNRRWAATSRDPSVLTALLADLVLSGNSENISRLADDQDGLEYKQYFPVPMNRILNEAKAGKYWVGPIPGIDHWKTTLLRTYGYKPDSSEGKALIERARSVFGNPVYDGNIVARSMRPVWPADLSSARVTPEPPPAIPVPSFLPTAPGGSEQPFLDIDGERVLIFGDSLSHPGADDGPTATDVTSPELVARSGAPGAVLASHLLAGIGGQQASAVRINARVSRSARSFIFNEDAASLLENDRMWKPTKVIVMLGTNDIDRGVGPEALEQTKDAMRQIRDAYLAMDADVVAIGPPSYGDSRYTQAAPAMLEAMREVFGADRVLDAQPLTVGAGRGRDGIHFSQPGSILAGKQLAEALT